VNNCAWQFMLHPGGQERSLTLTESALQMHHSYTAAITNSALIYGRRGEFIRSIIMLQKAIDTSTDFGGRNLFYIGYARFLFSESLSNTNHFAQIKLNLLHQAKNNFDDSIRHGFSDPSVLHSRGSVSLALNEPVDAILFLTAALNKSNAHRSISKNGLTDSDDIIPSHTYNQLGNAYKVARRYEEAAEAYNNALSSGDIDVTIAINLGDLYRQMGKFESSRETFNRVLEGSNNAILPLSFYNNYGMLEYDTGSYRQALELFKKALGVHETVGSSPNEVSGLESHLQIIMSNIEKAQKGIESIEKFVLKL